MPASVSAPNHPSLSIAIYGAAPRQATGDLLQGRASIGHEESAPAKADQGLNGFDEIPSYDDRQATSGSVQRPRWLAVARPERFHLSVPRWQIVARAAFELTPDYSERVFLWGDNISLAVCSLAGIGQVHFHRPLSSPILRVYIKDALAPVHLLEVSQYEAKFKTLEWPLDTSRVEEFIFECQIAA